MWSYGTFFHRERWKRLSNRTKSFAKKIRNWRTAVPASRSRTQTSRLSSRRSRYDCRLKVNREGSGWREHNGLCTFALHVGGMQSPMHDSSKESRRKSCGFSRDFSFASFPQSTAGPKGWWYKEDKRRILQRLKKSQLRSFQNTQILAVTPCEALISWWGHWSLEERSEVCSVSSQAEASILLIP